MATESVPYYLYRLRLAAWYSESTKKLIRRYLTLPYYCTVYSSLLCINFFITFSILNIKLGKRTNSAQRRNAPQKIFLQRSPATRRQAVTRRRIHLPHRTPAWILPAFWRIIYIFLTSPARRIAEHGGQTSHEIHHPFQS